MVSSPHEAMHRIFQQYPGLFSGVSEVLGIDFPPPTSVTVLPNDLTEASPVERRVDTLLRLDAEDGEPLLLAVEAQGGKDPDKPASWAYYASYLLTKYRLQPLLMVVCQDRATAKWAAREVNFGPRQWPLLTLRPARRRTAQHAGDHRPGRSPQGSRPRKSMTTVLRDTPQSIANPIIELIAQGLGKHPAAQLWRKLVAVDLSFYKSPLSEEIRDEGRAEGRAEGEARRAAEDVLDILEVRGIDVPEAVRERITGCGDPEILRHWHRRAVTVPTAEDIFTDE
jgi:hypothetical protein